MAESLELQLDFSLLQRIDIEFELEIRGHGPPFASRDLNKELKEFWNDPKTVVTALKGSTKQLTVRVAEFGYNLVEAEPTEQNYRAAFALYSTLYNRCRYTSDEDDPDKSQGRKIVKLLRAHMDEFSQRCKESQAPTVNKNNEDNVTVLEGESPGGHSQATRFSHGRGRGISTTPFPSIDFDGRFPPGRSHLNIPNYRDIVGFNTSHLRWSDPQPSPFQNSQAFHEMRPVPFKDWGISFSGKRGGKKVRIFIMELERMCVAQGISLQTVARAARLFLTDDALVWYNNCWQYLSTWQQFKTAIQSAFEDFESDFSIRKRIEERKQRVGEPVEVFIVSLYELVRELEDPISEKVLIRLVRRNLLPEFSSALALVQADSMNQLVDYLKQIERNRLISSPIPSTNTVSRKASVNVSEISADNKPLEKKVVKKSVQKKKSNAKEKNDDILNLNKCVNCGEGHNIRDCEKPRKCNVMCYRCGLENTITSRCPVCNKKESGSAGEGGATQ